MDNIVKPEPEDFADIEDFFEALNEYYEDTLYAGMIVTAV